MINLKKIFDDVSQLDTIEAIQRLIIQGVTPEQYAAAYRDAEHSCHICGQYPSILCEGCNKFSCEKHFTEALCDTCMEKIDEMSEVEREADIGCIGEIYRGERI